MPASRDHGWMGGWIPNWDIPVLQQQVISHTTQNIKYTYKYKEYKYEDDYLSASHYGICHSSSVSVGCLSTQQYRL